MCLSICVVVVVWVERGCQCRCPLKPEVLDPRELELEVVGAAQCGC